MKLTISFFQVLIINFLFWTVGSTQVPQVQQMDKAFDQELKSLLDFSVPILYVDQLESNRDNIILLDAREKKEYEVSHIPGAQYVGYYNWDKDLINSLDKSKTVVLYCSVGYRSEKLGEKLQNMGFDQVYNLYGSIFEWANQGNPLEDKNGQPTNAIHTYNKKWSKWVTSPLIDKKW